MPTYQYSCTECGHFFEAVQSFSDDSLTVCPECQGRLRKVFNAVGVVFKGSGFYRNDSRSTSGSSASGSSSDSSGSAGSSSSTNGSGTSGSSGTGDSGSSGGSKKAEKSSSTTKTTSGAGSSSS